MKTIDIDGLIFCPLCGTSPVMYRNASKRFRITCPRCGAKTDWASKSTAIIEWYNMHFTMRANRILRSQPDLTIR